MAKLLPKHDRQTIEIPQSVGQAGEAPAVVKTTRKLVFLTVIGGLVLGSLGIGAVGIASLSYVAGKDPQTRAVLTHNLGPLAKLLPLPQVETDHLQLNDIQLAEQLKQDYQSATLEIASDTK